MRLSLLLILILSAVLNATPSNSAVILMYHHFGEPRYPSTNISLTQFDAHLDYLERNHFKVWPLQKIIERLKSQQPIPPKVVAITIDDAYRSIYDHAFPRLKKRDWPFTIFVSTDAIDKRMPAFMSWEQMREIQQYGVTFANHSTHHDFLIEQRSDESLKQWRKRIRADLQHAQQRLQQELGTVPPLFAYPYGEYNLELQQIIHDLGWPAFGQHSGVISHYADITALPRYPVAGRFANLDQFKTKVMSLPLPVTREAPKEPQLGTQNPPRLQLSIELDNDIQIEQLNCFASNQGAAKVNWIDKAQGVFTVVAHQPFTQRRSRYNCTAPSKSSKQFYWYSHLWIQSQQMKER